MIAAAIVTTSAHMSVDGFARFRAGDGAWIEKSGELEIATGEEGSVVRFEATTGRDVMTRWVVVEPGRSYRVEKSACAGIAFRDLGKKAKRPFVQVDAHRLPKDGFPLRVLAADGAELGTMTWPDVGGVTEAQVDTKCPDRGARVRVVDASGTSRLDEWIVIPNERVTRVALLPAGGFSATAFDASMIYLREDAARVDVVELRVRRLSLSTIGLVQYLAPTGQFLLAVAFYDEPFTRAHVVTFACIWTSLAIYSADALLALRRAPSPSS